MRQGLVVAEHVTLQSELDAGGMGSIWVADHAALGRQVAVKFMTEELAERDPTLRDRFKREAAVLDQVSCPRIVAGHGQGTLEDGTPYIVMELLRGDNLVNVLEERGTVFTFEELDQLVEQLAEALAHIHQFDIVHRDLKSENVFVDAASPLSIKLIDFGLAKVPDMPGHAALTAPGMLVGSAEYMSPEQIISAATVDHQADLWALAVVLYVAATLELPFRGEKLSEVFNAIRTTRPVPPSQHRPELGAAIDAWFEKAFHPQRIERFQSAHEMAETWRDARRGKVAGAAPSFDVMTLGIGGAVVLLVAIVVLILVL